MSWGPPFPSGSAAAGAGDSQRRVAIHPPARAKRRAGAGSGCHREARRGQGSPLAVNGALDAMPGDFAIRGLLMDHRREVYNMLYEDFDKQAAWMAGAEDGKEVGKEEGIEIGREQAHVEFATNLIREGLTSAERISRLVGMPLDEVVRLAGELGATLPLV